MNKKVDIVNKLIADGTINLNEAKVILFLVGVDEDCSVSSIVDCIKRLKGEGVEHPVIPKFYTGNATINDVRAAFGLPPIEGERSF